MVFLCVATAFPFGLFFFCFFFFQAEDGIRYLVRSRGLGVVYNRQFFGDAQSNSRSRVGLVVPKRLLLGPFLVLGGPVFCPKVFQGPNMSLFSCGAVSFLPFILFSSDAAAYSIRVYLRRRLCPTKNRHTSTTVHRHVTHQTHR